MGDQNPQDFAEKVLQSLKKSSRAVDLSDKPEVKPVVEKSEPVVSAQSNDVQAFGQPGGGGQGPGTGGNKDIVIIPGYGGAAATSTSQVNFYWNGPAVADSTGVDTNVRATIYNYATSTTNPVLVIGGYNGSSQFKPNPLYGGGTGVTAKILIDPFLGRIDVDQIGLNTGVGISTDQGVLTFDSTQSKLRVGVGSGIAKTVAYTDDVQAASGAATTAQNIHMQLGVAASSHSIPFSLQATGAGVALSSDAELTYNPNTNTLTYTNASVSGTINSTTIPTSKTLVVTTDFGTGVATFLATPSSANLINAVTGETGTGALVFAESPTLVTPTLGVASATTINKVTFTAPATSATLTLAQGSTLATSGANSLTFTTTATTGVTLPTAGTLTTTGNKLSDFAATTSAEFINTITGETGTGALVFAESPTLVTPTLGVASATTINKVTFTAPATSATLTLAQGSTLATSGANSLTLTTTAASSVTFPTAGILTTQGNKLNVFASTTSTELATVISGTTGTGNLVFASSPSLTTPTLGVASATTINKVAFTTPTTAATLTLADNSTLTTVGAFGLTLTTTAASSVTLPTAGTLTTTGNKLNVFASTTSTELATVINGTTGTGNLVFATSPSFTTPALGTPSSGNLASCTGYPIASVANLGTNVAAFLADPTSAKLADAVTGETGSGALVFATSPALTTPSLGVASATSLTSNSVRIGNAVRTVDTSTGNLILDSTGGQVDINDNVVISGNLTVQGTTITIDSTVSTIVDPVIVVGSGVGGTHSTLDNNMDRGIEFRWSTGAGNATTGFFGFSDTDGKFRFIPNATISSANVYTGSVGTIVANFEGSFTGTITGTASTAANLNTVSNASSTEDHFILFSRINGGSGVAVSSDSTLKYVPSADNLFASKLNNITVTTPASAATLTLANNSSLITSGGHSLTFTTTATTGVTLPTAGTLTTTGNKLSDFAATTSAELLNTITGETGTGALVFAESPTLVTPTLGVASATTINKVTFTAPATSATLTLAQGSTLATSGANSLTLTTTAASSVTFPTAGTLTTTGNKLNVFASTTSTELATVISGTTGTGNLVFASSPSLTTPTLGVASATTINKVTFTAPTTAATLTLADNSTLTTVGAFGLTLTTTAASSVTFPTAGTLTTTGNKLNVFASTTAGEFINVINGTTGTGNLVFASSPSFTTPALGTPSSGNLASCTGYPIASVANLGTNVAAFLADPTSAKLADAVTGETGSGALVFATSPSLTTPTLGVASATTINKVAFTAPASSATLALADGSTLTTAGAFGLTLTTTAATNVTFPTAGTLTTTGNKLNVFASTTAGEFINVINGTTGTGNLVFATSPSFTTPVLGTPSSGNLASCTGYPIASVANLGTNVATFLTTPSSANLGNALTDKTGTGANVFAVSPSLTTPTITSASALASGTYLTVKTHSTDDSSTTDFFIRGLTSGDVSKFSVDANGNLRATTKSFDIPHPTKEGMRLVYGVLEGPEHGVYHRGTIEGKGNLLIELPDYWSELVNEDYTVTLTPHGNYGVHIVRKSLNSFIISLSGNLISKKFKAIKVDYLVHGSRKDAPLTIEQPE